MTTTPIEPVTLREITDENRDAVAGDGSPWPFYERFGFVPTGELEGDEIDVRVELT
jgi:hypothetical protein